MSSVSIRSASHNPASINQVQGDGIVELVSAHAAFRPTALAVEDHCNSITYQELDIRAAEVGHRLRSLGVGPNQVVGLCVPRSVAMVVGALAILKSGGAYLPIDPNSPTSRISFQLNDAGVSTLITTDCAGEQLAGDNWRVIKLTREGRPVDARGDVPGSDIPSIKVHGEDLIYVIYTSGSTGQPKGVEITHSNLQNLVSWH